ncbi:B-cell CLL/lymphoma 7 protein family member B [Tupaia chinensis]|uniref:B-cell CLL/lymphoma 7 protein family member B n=1 Tax=Tupaia chinensis TaxID=246437 RepID=L9KFT6_TUPCH|nr:B-cell CLL/lymphoma 7 protein family member B [Tupaia chinensis]
MCLEALVLVDRERHNQSCVKLRLARHFFEGAQKGVSVEVRAPTNLLLKSPETAATGSLCINTSKCLPKEKSKSNSSAARESNGFPSDASANSSLLLEFQDENSNQSSVSDVYQLKVDSSTNSSPSPQQSESLSPAHTSDFRTDDSQPPTLGQEILEEPSLPASEVADEPPTLTKEEPVPLETQITEEEEDSGAPPLKRFCVDQPAVPQTASES